MPPTSERLRVVVRPDTGALTIVGTVAGVRVRRRADTNSRATAEREAIRIAHEILTEQAHGKKPGSRSLQDAIILYIDTSPRAPQILRLLDRILVAIGRAPVPLAEINQSFINGLKPKMMSADARPGSITRTIISPIRAVMNLACDEGWCTPPRFKAPKTRRGEGKRTEFYTPAEAFRMLEAAEPYFRLALLGYFCTGMRHTELLTLDWDDVNLTAKTITVRAALTKNGIDRVVHIVPALLAALSAVPQKQRQGAVIRQSNGKPYLAYVNRFLSFPDKGRDRQKGGIEYALDIAIQRAGVKRLTCHSLRHTWASWWYAANGKDLLGLKHAGGWATLSMVERYAHHDLVGHEDAIKAFWHVGDTGLVSLVATA
jgi:integrase